MQQDEKDTLLLERVKELSCLYDLAKIAQSTNRPYRDVLQAFVNRIPSAWKYADCAMCELELNGDSFVSEINSEHFATQEQEIFLGERKIGTIYIHYTDSKRSNTDFLEEEKQLLARIAVEVSLVIERHEARQRENAYMKSMQRQDRLNILSEITAGIAHELNTPLGTIFGFSQLIISSNIDQQTVADAQKIFDAAKHASEIVKKLMLFSCDLPQNYEYRSMNALVENAILLLKPNLLAAEVELEFTKASNEELIRVDPVQISQVIFNLIINSIQASAPGGKIEVDLSFDKNRLELKITDHGKGIDPSIIDKIFEPFFSTKKSSNGTGLGLSVVHGIVRSHGGTIFVQSEPHLHTTFTITLPITK